MYIFHHFFSWLQSSSQARARSSLLDKNWGLCRCLIVFAPDVVNLNDHKKLLFKRLVFLVCLFSRTSISPCLPWARPGSTSLSSAAKVKRPLPVRNGYASPFFSGREREDGGEWQKGTFYGDVGQKGGVTATGCVWDKGANWCVLKSILVV